MTISHKIPLARAFITDQELSAVNEVLRSGWLTHGPKNSEFEAQFADYIGVKHAISMNSCTSALFLALVANDIKGEVILPSFTFVASANAVVTAGAMPVFADISLKTYTIDPYSIESFLNDKTEAIMVVHYGGQCCEMDKISEICRKHNLLLIEDSAETIGGMYKGKKSGNWGIGCFSFFPTKNITTGEGGMFTTNNDTLAEKVRAYTGHGIVKSTFERIKTQKPWFRAASYPGYNFRMSNILAAIGVEQMKKIDRMNDKRRERSFQLLDELEDAEGITTPFIDKNSHHVFQMFTIRVESRLRDGLVHYLKEKGIESSVHFDPPVHKHPFYEKYADTTLMNTEEVSNSILTLPMYPEITREEISYISETLKTWCTSI